MDVLQWFFAGCGLAALLLELGLLLVERRRRAPTDAAIDDLRRHHEAVILELRTERQKDVLQMGELLEKATGIEEAVRRNRKREGGAEGGRPRTEEQPQAPASLADQLEMIKQRARATGKMR